MKPFHKSIMVWTTTIMAVLSVLQQQASLIPPLWAAGVAVILAIVVAVRQWSDTANLPDGPGNGWLEMVQSLPLWCGIGMGAATALQGYTTILPASVASAITTVLAVLPVIKRANDALYSTPPAGTAASATSQAGFIKLGALLVIVVTVAIGIALTACSAPQWPKGCSPVTVNNRQILQCQCPVTRFAIARDAAKPRPAGVVAMTCGDQPMPIEVHADDVSLPICQP